MASAQHQRVLVVDDDAPLLDLMCRYLRRLGYTVDGCSGPEEAWSRIEDDPAAYCLALLDLRMPGMGGNTLAKRILQCNPSIRLVVVSGYSVEQSGIETLDGSRVTFLQKPFTPAGLTEAVRQTEAPSVSASANLPA